MAPAECSSARRLWVAQPAERRPMRLELRTEPGLRTGPKTAAVSVYVLASRRGSCCAGSWCVLFETYEFSFWTGGLRLHDFRPGPGPDSDGSKPQRAGTHCNERTLREQQIFSDSVTVGGAEPARPGRRGFPSTRDPTRFGSALRFPTGDLRNSGDRP